MKNWYKRIVLSLSLLLLVLYAWPQCQKIIYRAGFNLKRFILLKADYEQLYNISPLYRTIKGIKNSTPENSRITLAPAFNKDRLQDIVIKYQLYPRMLTPHGKLLSKNLFLFLDLSLWLILIGTLILKGLSLTPLKGNTSWFYSSAYLLGLLALCLPLWILLMLKISFNPITVLALMLVISILSFLFSRLKISNQHDSPAQSINKPKRFTEYCTDGLSLGLIFLFIGIIISIPISVWDEMSIWILKARIFSLHQGLDFSYTDATNNYYPILWPLNNAFYFNLIGDYDEIAKWISALTFLSFLAQLRGCLFFLGVKRPLLWPLIALYLILFQHWTFYTALPENLLMAFLMAMTAWGLMWFNDPLHSKKYLLLVLIMALGVTLTKFEGAIIACLGGLSLILNGPGHSLKSDQVRSATDPEVRTDFIYAASFLILLLIPWGWSQWVAIHGNPVLYYHLHGQISVQNINTMFRMTISFLMKAKIFFLMGAALLSVLALRQYQPWAKQGKFLFFWWTAMVLFSITAGVFWPSADLQRYYPEVLSRLLIRTTPILMLIWAMRSCVD